VIKAWGLQQGGELLGYYIDKNHILRRHLGKPLRQQFSYMYNIVNYPVTPGFKGKSECKNTCAPGSSYTHASTQ
jgi:hypothetical protein